MAKHSTYDGFQGKGDLLKFDPDKVVLVDDPAHPLFDERVKLKVDQKLVESILFDPDGKGPQGVLKPILATKNVKTGAIEAVDGRQRTLALRAANERLGRKAAMPLPVILLKPGTDVRAMAALISSNKHRPETPLGLAKKAQRYLEIGKGIAEVATMMGISQATVKNYMALLAAPADVQRAVESGEVSASAGYALAKKPAAEARKKLAKTKGKRGRKAKAAATGASQTKGRKEMRAKLDEMRCFADNVKAEGWVEALTWALGGEVEAEEQKGAAE